MYADPHTAAAQDRRSQLRLEAAQHQLVRLASCCRPSVVTAALRRVVRRLREDQLGAGYVSPRAAALRQADGGYCCA